MQLCRGAITVFSDNAFHPHVKKYPSAVKSLEDAAAVGLDLQQWWSRVMAK